MPVRYTPQRGPGFGQVIAVMVTTAVAPLPY